MMLYWSSFCSSLAASLIHWIMANFSSGSMCSLSCRFFCDSQVSARSAMLMMVHGVPSSSGSWTLTSLRSLCSQGGHVLDAGRTAFWDSSCLYSFSLAWCLTARSVSASTCWRSFCSAFSCFARCETLCLAPRSSISICILLSSFFSSLSLSRAPLELSAFVCIFFWAFFVRAFFSAFACIVAPLVIVSRASWAARSVSSASCSPAVSSAVSPSCSCWLPDRRASCDLDLFAWGMPGASSTPSAIPNNRASPSTSMMGMAERTWLVSICGRSGMAPGTGGFSVTLRSLHSGSIHPFCSRS
mmetsp:Transcript_3671/g.9881  ORF Transcript_3671/g.9881 Transcript_3671/m.9881 type:complete len:300 (-) Transcript_3671:697-1596(-)